MIIFLSPILLFVPLINLLSGENMELSSGIDKLMKSNAINTILLEVAYWFSS